MIVEMSTEVRWEVLQRNHLLTYQSFNTEMFLHCRAAEPRFAGGRHAHLRERGHRPRSLPQVFDPRKYQRGLRRRHGSTAIAAVVVNSNAYRCLSPMHRRIIWKGFAAESLINFNFD